MKHIFLTKCLTIGSLKMFDNGLEVRNIFLDIYKASPKVWHVGFIFKLKQNGSSGELLHILSDF